MLNDVEVSTILSHGSYIIVDMVSVDVSFKSLMFGSWESARRPRPLEVLDLLVSFHTEPEGRCLTGSVGQAGLISQPELVHGIAQVLSRHEASEDAADLQV